MCGIFQKKGKKGKTLKTLGKNIQDFKIFWKRAGFLSHLDLKTLERLFPCFLISSTIMILFPSILSCFIKCKVFATHREVWFLSSNFNMLFFYAFENNPCTKWFVAKRLGSAIFYYFFIIFTFRKWYIAKFLHYIITTKWIIPNRRLSLQKDVQIVQN